MRSSKPKLKARIPAYRFAVIGDPIAHSKSPAMHQAAYKALELPHTYVAIRATPEELPRYVHRLRDGDYSGFNITVPYKTKVLSMCDEVAGSAKAAGAANTLVCTSTSKVVAHNTDAPGLAKELARLAPKRAPDEWASSKALVIGSGGAARSALLALAILGVKSIVVRARKHDALGDAKAGVTYEPLEAGKSDGDFLTVIQATSAGMTGADPGDGVAAALAWKDLPKKAIAIDVVYAPLETPFLKAAAAHGITHANGLGMLASQGALAFSLWLGIPAPYPAMLAAIQ